MAGNQIGKFRVLDICADGHIAQSTDEAAVAPPTGGCLRWVDLQKQCDASLSLLRERFNFHPLAIEDCSHFDQRPKLEEFGDHLFIVNHAIEPVTIESTDLVIHELHAFMGSNYLVTVHEEPIPSIDEVWKRVSADVTIAKKGVDFLYYLVADSMVDADFPILDEIAEELEELEERILAGVHAAELGSLFRLKRLLVSMRKTLSPQRDVFALLAKHAGPAGSNASFYFRDIYDHLVRLNESVESNRDLLGNALDAHLTIASNRTNDIMKRLTILSSIFMPLTFVTGFFGQNFDDLPIHSTTAYYAMLAACFITPAVMFYSMKYSRWI